MKRKNASLILPSDSLFLRCRETAPHCQQSCFGDSRELHESAVLPRKALSGTSL